MKTREIFELKCGFINLVKAKNWNEAVATYEKEFGIDRKTARNWWNWYKREICVPEVCFESGGKSEILTGKSGSAEKLQSLPLVVKGLRNVEFMGKVYNLDREGLYRFSVISESVRNLIVIRNEMSVMPILEAMALMQVHGNRDSMVKREERKKLLLSRYWISLTCGCISALTIEVLTDAGFKARSVSSMTVDQWNTYNNGHMTIEVFFPALSRWVFVDIDMGYIFMSDGQLLDCYNFWQCVKENRQPTFVALAPKEIDPLWLENDYSYTHMWRKIVADIPSKWNWYLRAFQTFGFNVHDDRWVYLASGRTARRVLEYRGHYATTLSEKAFVEKFYKNVK